MKKRLIIIAIVVILAVCALLIYFFALRSDEAHPSAHYQTYTSPVKPKTVDFIELVGLSPSAAELTLGYPHNSLIDGKPEIVGQNDQVDIQKPVIVTAVCYAIKNSQDEDRAGKLVFEVANPEQVTPEDLSRLKKHVFEERRQNIKARTGCYSNTIGLPVGNS